MPTETQAAWERRMFEKVLGYLKGELCIDFPYLDRALSALEPKGREEIRAFATDGVFLIYPPARYLKLFEENELFLRRAYLHAVLHCLYAHLWQTDGRDPERWNVACDIAIEFIIDGFNKQSTNRLLSWTRERTYALLGEKHAMSAAQIYNLLLEAPEERVKILAKEFYTDDHSLWGRKSAGSPMAGLGQSPDPQKKWQNIARQTMFASERGGRGEGSSAEIVIKAERNRRSYKDFLMKFAAFHEQMRIDIDSFDPGYYAYGLRTYGNLPLIEPLETREERRIREFVVAVDTSYSTSGDLVRSFLRETLHILLEENAFFSTAEVHILQCDDAVRDDIVVKNARQAGAVLAKFEIKGGGGTDFRPAFTYVEQLRAGGGLRSLGGMLYFTDGNGVYPKKKPDYPCAFLFLDEYDEGEVPPWAMRMRLD